MLCPNTSPHGPHTWMPKPPAIGLSQDCPGVAVKPEEPTKALAKWADPAMFTAEPSNAADGPRVYLLWMTPDPLGAIAAACKMYKGEVVRNLADVTDKERREYLEQVLKTKLQAPLEFVKLHFLIEGVTRSFTHQMVRQRTAVYAQESLRFAVKEDAASAVALPPSLAGTETTYVCPTCYGEGRVQRPGWNCGCGPMVSHAVDCGRPAPFDKCTDPWHTESGDASQAQRRLWDEAVRSGAEAYNRLVAMGMPAEDARGLLPHNITTRLHYATDLRALLDHAGNRLCTQAQFEWRLVFARITEAIRLASIPPEGGTNGHGIYAAGRHQCTGDQTVYMSDVLADIFKPVCYQTGRCEFKANFDRACSIRDRVDANEKAGRPSEVWGEDYEDKSRREWSGPTDGSLGYDKDGNTVFIGAIHPAEWLMDPEAAR